MTAPCWTGLRKNRVAGNCKDGVTTCGQNLTWGACNGEVLPAMTGTDKATCQCFSTGHWQVDNLSPCFFTITDGMGNVTHTAVSTTPGNPASCPADPTMPSAVWSTDTLTIDCSGAYQVCYTLKAGDPHNPLATDCVIGQSCVSAHDPTSGQAFVMPPLPGWTSLANADACVVQFQATGGYGEMSVKGQTDECENVDKVFQRVTYCPLSCGDPSPPPICATCMSGGGGAF